jgi:hypothetical protein
LVGNPPQVGVLRFWEILKTVRAGEVGSEEVGKHGTRTQCTATNLTNSGTDRFAHAAGL